MPHHATALPLHLTLACTLLCPIPPSLAATPAKPNTRPGAVATIPQTTAKTWRVAPAPSWVAEPPAAEPSLQPRAPNAAPAVTLSLPGLPSGSAAAPTAATPGAARNELVDLQANFALAKPLWFYRARTVAYDTATLGNASQWQIPYNPTFQTVTLHRAQVIRDGRAQDRLATARIENLRRETQLERQIIDGTQTLLVVLSDVRVGEPVDISYSIEGANPLFEGKVSGGLETATSVATDVMHHRVILPAHKTVQVRAVGGDLLPERSVEGDKQVLRLVRTNVPALVEERQTPPWVKVYPAWYFSEYASWSDVDAWAQRLFAQPASAAPAIKVQADVWRQAGLQGEALVAEVLRFVQDDVRYFSVSLGESSHRPKAAERTLAERLGDCKDKVMLLNALLTELGITAQPALVSVFRNRGLAQYLPSHDPFDHVISRVELGGRVWFLDATISGQGLSLASRGYYPFGRVLVVGAGKELSEFNPAPEHLDEVEHEQRWDLSHPGEPVRLSTVMRAKGAAAESWRATWAAAGQDRISEALAGSYARLLPGLVRQGPAQVKDDRPSNVFELRLSYEHPNFGQYNQGALEAEFAAFELLDTLVSPPEATRRTPYLLNIPRSSSSRIDVLTPQPYIGQLAQPIEVQDKAFSFSSRMQAQGNVLSILRRVERRRDEVTAADLATYRANLLRARNQTSNTLRISLVNFQSLLPDLQQAQRRLVTELGARDDVLNRIAARAEFNRQASIKIVGDLPSGSGLAAQVLASSATSANLLGQYDAALLDADKALQIDATSVLAQEARAVALLSLGRLDDSSASWQKLLDTPTRGAALKGLATADMLRGRHAQAEANLRQLVEISNGEQRDFALVWLYLAAEYQGRRGDSALAPYADAIDDKRWGGTLLQFLSGKLDREALLKKARESTEMERLNLAEAYYYIGQRLSAQGQREEAMRWFDRSVQTKATPYREFALAWQELQRTR